MYLGFSKGFSKNLVFWSLNLLGLKVGPASPAGLQIKLTSKLASPPLKRRQRRFLGRLFKNFAVQGDAVSPLYAPALLFSIAQTECIYSPAVPDSSILITRFISDIGYTFGGKSASFRPIVMSSITT